MKPSSHTVASVQCSRIILSACLTWYQTWTYIMSDIFLFCRRFRQYKCRWIAFDTESYRNADIKNSIKHSDLQSECPITRVEKKKTYPDRPAYMLLFVQTSFCVIQPQPPPPHLLRMNKLSRYLGLGREQSSATPPRPSNPSITFPFFHALFKLIYI